MDASTTSTLTPFLKSLEFIHFDTKAAGGLLEMLASLTLSGFGPCGMCPSLIAEGLWFTTVNKWRWWTKASLNSSSVLVSSSFCRKVISENIVAKVRPTSVAVLVLFWIKKRKKNLKAILFQFQKIKLLICSIGHHIPGSQRECKMAHTFRHTNQCLRP